MIKRQLPIFLVVGSLTVVLDFTMYYGLTHFFSCNINFAKATGFIGGCIFAYFTNRYWTFNQPVTRSGSLWRFILVYALGLITNVLINQGILSSWDSPAALYAAFLMATGVSATLNFIGLKWFVFTQNTSVTTL